MHINFRRLGLLFRGFFIPVLFFASLSSVAQVNEPVTNEVYNYLYRMAQKGWIEWQDYQLPLDRRAISNALNEIRKNASDLTQVERKELSFYWKDFSFDSVETDTSGRAYFKMFSVNNESRYKTLLIRDGHNKLFLEPEFGASYLSGKGKSNTTKFSGVRVSGYFGKHFGMNFSFRDFSESGDSIDFVKEFSDRQGIINTGQSNKSLSYSKLNYNVTYKWKKGSLTVGKDDLIYGYGKGGNIILSGKAPSFPYILFNYTPWKWVHFNYFHGWLQSDVIDSLRSYNTGSGVGSSQRIIYRQKFIASHSIIVNPVKGLEVGIGESIVYSDKINIGYLVPVSFFKAFDHYSSDYAIEAGSNAQFFGLISSRNHIKNTHLYAQLFIDEIRLLKIFDKKERRNQLGYTLGINKTDLLLHYLSVGVEYTHINPFVYNNLIPTQTYTSHSYYLGDWMGNNADRVFIYADYTPLPKLKLRAEFQQIRKGAAGNLVQQYNQQPQPAFLFQKLFTYREVAGSISYELVNSLKVYARVNQVKWIYPTSNNSATGVSVGFSYGL